MTVWNVLKDMREIVSRYVEVYVWLVSMYKMEYVWIALLGVAHAI